MIVPCRRFLLLATGLVSVLLVPVSGKEVVISNVLPRRDANGAIMDCHDGNVHWEGGQYLLFCMAYGPCHNTQCATAECGGRLDHNVSLYASPDLTSGSWKYATPTFQKRCT